LRVIRAIARHSGYGGIWGIQCILFVCNNLRFDLDSQNGGAGGESGIRSFFAHLLSASYRKHNAKNAVNAIDPRAPCPPLPASMLGRSTGCALGLCTGPVSRGLWFRIPPRPPHNLHFPYFQVHSCISYPLFHLQPPADFCGKRKKACTRDFDFGRGRMWIDLARTQPTTQFRAVLWIEIHFRHSGRTDVTHQRPEGGFVWRSQHSQHTSCPPTPSQRA